MRAARFLVARLVRFRGSAVVLPRRWYRWLRGKGLFALAHGLLAMRLVPKLLYECSNFFGYSTNIDGIKIGGVEDFQFQGRSWHLKSRHRSSTWLARGVDFDEDWVLRWKKAFCNDCKVILSQQARCWIRSSGTVFVHWLVRQELWYQLHMWSKDKVLGSKVKILLRYERGSVRKTTA